MFAFAACLRLGVPWLVTKAALGRKGAWRETCQTRGCRGRLCVCVLWHGDPPKVAWAVVAVHDPEADGRLREVLCLVGATNKDQPLACTSEMDQVLP